MNSDTRFCGNDTMIANFSDGDSFSEPISAGSRICMNINTNCDYPVTFLVECSSGQFKNLSLQVTVISSCV